MAGSEHNTQFPSTYLSQAENQINADKKYLRSINPIFNGARTIIQEFSFLILLLPETLFFRYVLQLLEETGAVSVTAQC